MQKDDDDQDSTLADFMSECTMPRRSRAEEEQKRLEESQKKFKDAPKMFTKDDHVTANGAATDAIHEQLYVM